MGTASFTIGTYGKTRGGGPAMLMSSTLRTSGAHTTSTTASSLADAGGAVAMASGEVLAVHADEAMRVRFGGVAATASTGHYIPAGAQVSLECNDPGAVSIIDVA